MTLDVAIVGSGPSGCYAAEYLLKRGCRVDILDALPTPFGLVRYGVAPDHQSTKAVTRILSRALSHADACYVGNLRVGSDVSLAELRAHYDAVVVATGADCDRRLGIPGEDLPGVFGSRRFVDWYNVHPARGDRPPNVADARDVVVIGNGNVALDVCRLLVRPEDALAGSDLGPEETRALTEMRLRTIHLVGRRMPWNAGFSAAELAELLAVPDLQTVVHAPQGIGTPDRYADPLVHAALTAVPSDLPTAPRCTHRLHLHFGLTPQAFEGDSRLRAVRFATSAGTGLQVDAQLAINCIGYQCGDALGLRLKQGTVANDDGRVDAGLYVVGWAARGPNGTIGANRQHSHAVAQRLLEALGAHGRGTGREALRSLIKERRLAVTSWSDWLAIDAHERATAPVHRCRGKLRSLNEMLGLCEAPADTESLRHSA